MAIKHTAIDPQGVTHKRTSASRTYTHTVVRWVAPLTPNDIEEYVVAWEGICGSKDKARVRAEIVAKQIGEGYWDNCGWCGRLDLAQALQRKLGHLTGRILEAKIG